MKSFKWVVAICITTSLYGCTKQEDAQADASPDEGACQSLGELAPNSKVGQNEPCCQGLAVTRVDYAEVLREGMAYCEFDRAFHFVSLCLACGDGVCDEEYEDKCICPQDCGSIPQERYVKITSP